MDNESDNKSQTGNVKSGLLQRGVGLRANPRQKDCARGDWYKPATYPNDVMVCPLCSLPETTNVYKRECRCWDN